MKKIVRFSIIGIVISILLLFYKESFHSKLLASFSLMIFSLMFYFNYESKKSQSNKF